MGRKILALFFKNYMVLVTLLVSIELVGHIAYKIYKGRFLFQNDRQENILFKEHPYLVGVPKKNFQLTNESGDIKIGTDHLGNRVSYPDGMIHDKDAIQIVCLGGSSTFGTGVSDENTWPYMLQKKLGNAYCVTNLGVPGYSTMEAIIQLGTVVPKIKPDIIIMYQGWNDIKNYHRTKGEGDYYQHGIKQRTNLKVNRKKSLLEYSFIFFVAKKIRSRIYRNIGQKKTYPYNDVIVDSIYVRNLRTMKAMGDRVKAKQIFVPQVLNVKWFMDHKDIENPWTSTIPNGKMPEFMEKFNSLMYRSIPPEKGIIVIDSISYIHNWEEGHFVDEGHFSRAGGELFTNIINEAIEELESQNADTFIDLEQKQQ